MKVIRLRGDNLKGYDYLFNGIDFLYNVVV